MSTNKTTLTVLRTHNYSRERPVNRLNDVGKGDFCGEGQGHEVPTCFGRSW